VTHALLEVKRLSVYRGEQCVLENVSLDFEAGEQVALIGRNGAGKTSLLMALAGLTRYEGEVFFQNKLCHHGKHRQQIGYVPQRSKVRWDLPLQVLDVVMSGAAGDPHYRGWSRKKQLVERAHQALFEVDSLPLAKRTVDTLSGGQAQRVLIARSLICNPDILLLDEPLVGLDVFAIRQVLSVMDNKSKSGALVIAAMHELDIVNKQFNRVVFIENKDKIFTGTPQEVVSKHFQEKITS
jgi:ABC-type Mn2+/Zn2+ transport system ATPase subunit